MGSLARELHLIVLEEEFKVRMNLQRSSFERAQAHDQLETYIGFASHRCPRARPLSDAY
jgi:hypothetical protein